MVEYRCPDAMYAISRAVHLGRLARDYPPCRRCPHAGDVAAISPRQIRRAGEKPHSPTPGGPQMSDEGFGGVCHNELTPAAVQRLAQAFGLCLRNPPQGDTNPVPRVVLAGDGRAVAAELVAAAGEGLRFAGGDLVDIGAANAACLMLAIDRLAADGGLLVGNPSGRPYQAILKFFAPGALPAAREPWLEEIERLARAGVDRPTRRCGALERESADAAYLAALAPHYHALRPLRVVFHSTCAPILEYLRRLTAEVACRILPAPAASRLGEEVRREGAHFGIGIEDDGEICRVLDERGRPAPPEAIFLLLARHLLAERPGAAVVVEEGEWPKLDAAIASLTGRVVRSPPARDRMAAAMRASGAILGGGANGRIWHAVGATPLPDALWTLTLLLVLSSRDDRPFSALLDLPPESG